MRTYTVCILMPSHPRGGLVVEVQSLLQAQRLLDLYRAHGFKGTLRAWNRRQA